MLKPKPTHSKKTHLAATSTKSAIAEGSRPTSIVIFKESSKVVEGVKSISAINKIRVKRDQFQNQNEELSITPHKSSLYDKINNWTS